MGFRHVSVMSQVSKKKMSRVRIVTQEWSTYASWLGANDETKMFAFRKALPQALHQKIIGVSPQPTTLDGLAEKAREFDRIWRLYSNPSFTNARPQGPRNRALTTDEEEAAQVNVTSTHPQIGGTLSKEEKDRRFKEKLCFYCGKPNHRANKCRAKQATLGTGRRDQRPRKEFQAPAVTQDTYNEGPSEEHPAQVGALYYAPRTISMIPHLPFNQEEEGKDF